ncbi:MAG: hypothetical protein JKY95_06840 [Planctomycetaceae bacterium]|nr:hypothetical protein [Planctomycetaceae bacterium]
MVAWLILTIVISFSAVSSVQADQWVTQFEYEQYRVYSQVSTREISAPIKNLKRLRESLKEILQIELSDQPIELHIFSSQRNYREYVAPRVPEAVNRPAVFVKGPDALWVYVVYRKGWEADLRHEMTHANLHGSLPYLPIWLDEGLAKYFELPSSQKGFNQTFHQSLVWKLRFRKKIKTTDLEELESLVHVRAEHYRDSWAWIYYCLHSSPETRQFLQKYLQDIQAEQVPGSFFENIYQFDPGFQQQAIRFFRNI